MNSALGAVARRQQPSGAKPSDHGCVAPATPTGTARGDPAAVIPLKGISSVAAVIVAAALSAGCARVSTPLNYNLVSTPDPAAPSPIPLMPNDHGYVRVETESRSTDCSITTELVACQTSSDDWRAANGQRYHTASVNADGEFHWVEADLGEMQGRVQLGYQTYSAQGWTIVAGPTDTKFTNDRTGHGAAVSDQRVTPF